MKFSAKTTAALCRSECDILEPQCDILEPQTAVVFFFYVLATQFEGFFLFFSPTTAPKN